MAWNCAFNVVQLVWFFVQKPILESDHALEVVLRCDNLPLHKNFRHFIVANDVVDIFPVIDEGIEIDRGPICLN